MAMGRLSATTVKSASRPGRLGDGEGLYLVVTGSATESWMVRVQKHGMRRNFGLGSASKLSASCSKRTGARDRDLGRAGTGPVVRAAEGARRRPHRQTESEIAKHAIKPWPSEAKPAGD
ncbi:Arm DNA-binding domain-containing protein [Erythrobacter sp. NE805]|uniref:Arm DNA-binding domain-containing protein n=1 Tax=Erythrobacter sp. NE805 TaxID=3389875 RepID=UPI00396B3A9F